MSRDTQPVPRCPHCRAPLVLANAAGSSPFLALREEPSPPPVQVVLADYAGRVVDSMTALRGAARVRDSLAATRAAAAQRRALQTAARQGARTLLALPPVLASTASHR
jgi:hypothetical protein